MVSVKTIRNIKNFGTYKDFNWNLQKKTKNGSNEDIVFSTMNIFYGQNYSGKTTLSRIFRAFELGKMPSHYSNPEFTLQMNDGKPDITHSHLTNHNHVFRVFNQDFVKENLSFIHQLDGDIKSFAVTVGKDNIEIQKEINRLKLELGEDKQEKSTGLFKDNYELEKQLRENQFDKKEKDLSKQLSNKASNIKDNRDFNDVNYKKPSLENDINRINQGRYTQPSQTDIDEHRKIIKQQPLEQIKILSVPNLNFSNLSLQAKEAIEKDIIQTSTIEILRQNANLMNWAKQGIDLHKGQHDDCAFCGAHISQERWQKLDDHFNQESKELTSHIDELIRAIDKEQDVISGIFKIEKTQFYPKFHSDIQGLITGCEQMKANYLEQLSNLKKQLSDKAQDIFSQKTFNEPTDYSNEIKDFTEKYNDLVNQSSEHTNGLSQEIKFSQEALRLNAVKDFMDIIGYDNLKSEIEKLEEDKKRIEHDIEANKKAISNIRQEIDKQKLSNEAEGAKKVNKYIESHFGHPELKLQYIDNLGKFKVVRNGQEAHNLSEGECNLIAFCYFLAKLHDNKTSGAKPIIWIDDPISSLDDNHIFFIYSLIRAEMVDKNIFEQLFISTHSLNFLKYLQEIKFKNKDNDKNNKKPNFYHITKENIESNIRPMPKYLNKYATELHYLFEQIYNTAFIGNVDNDIRHHIVYNFANNARKFLEIYLLYVYPDNSIETKEKYENFYDSHINYYKIERVKNEGSHLKLFERSIVPFTSPETQKVAEDILLLLHKKDPEQVEGFVKSIGKDYEEFKQKLGLC